MAPQFEISVFESESPLAKSFWLDQSGELKKEGGGQLTKGYVARRSFSYMSEFADFLLTLNGTHALAYGVSEHQEARVLSKKSKDSEKGGDLPIITRTRENFSWPMGEGIFLIDYDPPKDGPGLRREEVYQAIIDACPGLEDAPAILWHSASSFLYNGDKQLKGEGGYRIYIRVKDASDIPRSGKVLFKRLWLSGHGYIRITENGGLVERAPVDAAVWQPERLDFAGGASCTPPIVQRRPAPVVLNDDFDSEAVDTRVAVPDLTEEEEAEYNGLVQAAKGRKKPQAKEIRKKWLENYLAHLSEEKREEIQTALDTHVLLPDFPLILSEDDSVVTVREVLANKEKYHKVFVRHPLEPDHQKTNLKVAQINTDGEPNVFTFARHGQTFFLKAQSPEEVFADVEAPEQTADTMEYPDPQKPLPRFKFLTRDEILAAPPLQWRVKGVIPSRGLAAMSGQSRAGKSFLVFDMACAIAEGRPWFGYRTKTCPIVYVCLEGEAGFKHRVEAWEKQNGRPMPAGITMIKEPFQIVDPTQVAGLAMDAPKNALIIVDTMSRSSAGVDENGPEGMGRIIKGGDDLQRLTDGIVLLVAHEGKDASKGLRGHSSLIAALDGHVVVTKDNDQCIWKIDKAKDGKDGAEHGFKLKVIELGLDEDGDKITSCVILPTEKPIRSRPKLTKAEQVGLDAFHAAMDDDFNGVRIDDWAKEFIKKHTGDNENSKRRIFRRIRSVLVEKGYLDVNDDTYYIKNIEDLETKEEW